MTQVCLKCHIEKPFNDFSYIIKKSEYKSKCKDCVKYSQEYYQNNRETILQRSKQWNRDNKVQYNENYRKRYNENPEVKLTQYLYVGINQVLKKYKESEIVKRYLGCTINKFKQWIEFQFYDGMNWENQGSYWHLDHTLPVSSFNFENEEQIKTCFNWKNLRPLRADKNKSKYNKLILSEYLFQEIKSVYFLKQTNN